MCVLCLTCLCWVCTTGCASCGESTPNSRRSDADTQAVQEAVYPLAKEVEDAFDADDKKKIT